MRLSTGQTLPGRVETVVDRVRPCHRSRRQRAAVSGCAAARHRQRRAAGTGSDRDRPRARRVSEQRHARHHQRRPPCRSNGDAADRCGHQSRQQRRPAVEPPGTGRRHQHDEGWRRSRVARLCGRCRSCARAARRRQGDRAVRTSAQQSQQLAPAFGARSSTDVARDEGTKRYGQVVEAVSRQAAQLDDYWNRIKANCAVRVAPGYDREWFGLWDGRATLDTPDTSCGSAVKSSRRWPRRCAR